MSSPLDIVTIAEARDLLTHDGSELGDRDERILARLVTSASLTLESRIGAVIIRNVDLRVDGPLSVRLELHHGDDHPGWPIKTITTLTETGTTLTAENPDVTTHGPNEYVIDGAGFGVVWRRAYGRDALWTPGRSNVRIVGTMGRWANIAAVPEHVKLAVAITARHLWEQDNTVGEPMEDGGGISPRRAYSVPARALHLVPYMTRPWGFAS